MINLFRLKRSSALNSDITHDIHTSYWPWSHKRTPATHSGTTTSPSDPMEAKKTVISKDLYPILLWHCWGIIPCLATVVLLYLNLSEYVIGAEVGGSRKATDNILGTLQVAAKVYEILGIVCLANIVQQWIQWSLLRGGTLFGLLGAEQSFASIQFLNSKEYLAAISYGFRGIFWWADKTPKEHRHRRKVLLLAAFMALASLLSAVVGPASAVLMVPQKDWFWEENRDWLPSGYRDQPSYFRCYPYIMIDPRLGVGEYTPDLLDNFPLPEYWRYAWYMKDPSESVWAQDIYAHQQHIYMDIGIPTVINYTTIWGRPLVIDTNWEGGSRFTTAIRRDIRYMTGVLYDYEPTPKYDGSKAQFIHDTSGIETYTVCRKRRKVSCNRGNESEWCFMHVTMGGDAGELLSSRDLLLIVDYSPGGGNSVSTILPRIWMTEGPRVKNRKFTDSIVFIFEDSVDWPTPEPLLTVCSTNATLRSVTATSSSKLYTATDIQLFDYLYYFQSTPGNPGPPRTFLYHENWLDLIHEPLDAPYGIVEPVMQYGNKTYPPRSELKPTENLFLKPWAIGIQNANSYWTTPLLWPRGNSTEIEAGEVEMIVGGAFLSMLSRKMRPADSQYAKSYIRNTTTRASEVVTYPKELMPEPSISCQFKYTPISIYHEVYGYRSTSTAGILSMLVLVTLVFVALLGSLWQCRRGAIVNAWSSIPEYVTLSLGTEPPLDTLDNTCAGIGSKETMKTIVMIKETVGDHLELVLSPSLSLGGSQEIAPPSLSPETGHEIVSPSPPSADIGKVVPNRKYGVLGSQRRREKPKI